MEKKKQKAEKQNKALSQSSALEQSKALKKSSALNTSQTKKEKAPEPIKWYLIDAADKILGKVSVTVAKKLLAKDDPGRKIHQIPTERVVVINAGKIAVTGRKEEEKKYYRYSGYPSGLKVRTLSQLRETKPTEIISHAVFGMLPKNRLGRKLQKHLFVYPGSTHPHQAQKIENLEVT